MSLCFFFKNAETYGQNRVKLNPPPPPPSLFISKQRRISIFEGQNTVHVSFTLLEGDWGGRRWGGGGGGRVNFQECVWSLASPLVEKKTQGHFLTQKESTCQISADSEQLGKSLRNSHLGLACTEPFNCNSFLIPAHKVGSATTAIFFEANWKGKNKRKAIVVCARTNIIINHKQRKP